MTLLESYGWKRNERKLEEKNFGEVYVCGMNFLDIDSYVSLEIDI